MEIKIIDIKKSDKLLFVLNKENNISDVEIANIKSELHKIINSDILSKNNSIGIITGLDLLILRKED